MKKLMSLILAATMAFGLAVPAMAEIPPEEAGAAVDTSNSGAANSGAGSQAVEIAFEVPETFTWNIPNLENIEVHPENHLLSFNIEKSIGISDCYLAANHHIELGINCTTELMSETEKKIPFIIKMKALVEGTNWYRPTEGSMDVPFKLATDDNPRAVQSLYKDWYSSGTWQQVLTFTAKIEESYYETDDYWVAHTNEQLKSIDF